MPISGCYQLSKTTYSSLSIAKFTDKSPFKNVKIHFPNQDPKLFLIAIPAVPTELKATLPIGLKVPCESSDSRIKCAKTSLIFDYWKYDFTK